MRIAQIIGTVTLNTQDPSYKGGRFLVGMPLSRQQLGGAPLHPFPEKANSLVIYDNLGAHTGDLIAFSESGEAAAAFELPTPVDAYNCAILDTINYDPPARI